MLAFVLIFLAVVAAYYFLGTPLLTAIHQFTEQFTHSFPLWAFFLPVPIPRGGRQRRGDAAGGGGSPTARKGTPRFR